MPEPEAKPNASAADPTKVRSAPPRPERSLAREIRAILVLYAALGVLPLLVAQCTS